MPREEIVYALDAIQEPVSLFEPIYHDGGDPIFVMDQISDEKNEDSNWLEGISIREAMSKLGERERLILTMRFFGGRTQMECSGRNRYFLPRFPSGESALKHLRRHMVVHEADTINQ